jgi:UDP-glucuronate 4-epimerase
MNIVVTGGAGFIGSHLCEELLRSGNRLQVIDNFNNFYNPDIKRRNIKEIQDMMKKNNILESNFNLYECDIRDKEALGKIINREIDVVVHLAAMAGVRNSIENPRLYYEVNVLGTLNLLEACKANNVSKIIFASSSSVYGNNKAVPFKEEDRVDFPISPYAATKKSGELLCYTYHLLYSLSIASLRFFTVYGPRQRPDLAIHKFTQRIFKGEEIPFYGDGTSKRDYTFISDIVDGILKAIEWINKNDNSYEIFNLGESRTISLNFMIDTIEKAIGEKAKKKMLPMQGGDVNITYADITKAKQILGYNPTMQFEAGIEKFIEWYRRVNGW